MRIIFTCGGTGGHIYPALAIADYVRRQDPTAEILFVGGDNGMETKLVPEKGFKIKTVPAHGFWRGFKWELLKKNFNTAIHMHHYMKMAEKIVKDFAPDIVVGTGGYASYSAIHAAQKLKIPTLLHEANAIPGLTTQLVEKKASRILVNFAGTEGNYKDPSKVRVVGMPVQNQFLTMTKSEARKQLGIPEDAYLVASFMGSQGAMEMNIRIADLITKLAKRDDYYLIHACGIYGWEWMPDKIKGNGVDLEKHPNIDLREYIHDMPRVLSAADLVVCRAGASTLSEVCVAGIPAILAPSPNVANNHQEKNARVIEKAGGAFVVLEKDISGEDLDHMVEELLHNEQKRKEMSENLKKLAVVDSTKQIYEEIQSLINK